MKKVTGWLQGIPRFTPRIAACAALALIVVFAGCGGTFSSNTSKGLASAQAVVHGGMNGYGASVRAGFVDAQAQKHIDEAYADWQLLEKGVSDSIRAFDAFTAANPNATPGQIADEQAKVTAALAKAVKAGNDLYALIQKLTGSNKSGALKYLKEQYGEDITPAMLDRGYVEKARPVLLR